MLLSLLFPFLGRQTFSPRKLRELGLAKNELHPRRDMLLILEHHMGYDIFSSKHL